LNKGALIFLVVVVLTTLLSVGFVNAGREVSWISTIEELIIEENWIPDKEYWPIMVRSFFLIENGEDQFFLLEFHDQFVSYVEGLLGSVDRKLPLNLSRDSLDELLSNGRFLELYYRFPTTVGVLEDVIVAYFVLEDGLGLDLDGAILVRDKSSSGPGRENKWYSVWEITDRSVLYKSLSFQNATS